MQRRPQVTVREVIDRAVFSPVGDAGVCEPC